MAAGQHVSALAHFGVSATNVSGARSNCFFHAQLHWASVHGHAYAAGRVGDDAAAEALRRRTWHSLSGTRRAIAAAGASTSLIDELLRVRGRALGRGSGTSVRERIDTILRAHTCLASAPPPRCRPHCTKPHCASLPSCAGAQW